jgi:hypothetical protein
MQFVEYGALVRFSDQNPRPTEGLANADDWRMLGSQVAALNDAIGVRLWLDF